MWKVDSRKLVTAALGVLLAGTSTADGQVCSLSGPSEIHVRMVHDTCGDNCYTHVLAAGEDPLAEIELDCPVGTTPDSLTCQSLTGIDVVSLSPGGSSEQATGTLTAELLAEICRERLGQQWEGDEYHTIEGTEVSTVVTLNGSCAATGVAPTCTRDVTVVCEDHCIPPEYWGIAQHDPDPGPPYCLCGGSIEPLVGVSDGEPLVGVRASYYLPRYRAAQIGLGVRDGSEPGVSRVGLVDLSYAFFLRPEQRLNPYVAFGPGWAFVDESSGGPRPTLEDGATFHLGGGLKVVSLNRRTFFGVDLRARWLEGAGGSGVEGEVTFSFGLKLGCCG